MEVRSIDGDISSVALSGRLVLGRPTEWLDLQVNELLGKNRKKIILDLSDVHYMDGAGVGTIVGCAGKVKDAGGRFRVAGCPDRLLQILRMTGVDRVLALDVSVEASLASLGQA